MNSAFLQSAGVAVSVSFPDSISRPRVPMPPSILVAPMGAQPIDIKLAWLPTYPDVLHKLRPIAPARIGVFDAASFEPAIRPLGWEPHYPTYWDAARLHRAFLPFSFDPLSGEAMNAAILMSWDPKQKAPLITRPRLQETTAFFYVQPDIVITTGAECVELINVQGAVPLFTPEALTAPALVSEALTVPTLSPEAIC